MGFFDFLKKQRESIEVASRKPVGKFQVVGITSILGRQVLGGIVIDGVVYPGYKLKGNGVAVVREIHIRNRKVDFAVEGDQVALVLEGVLKVNTGEFLEIYQS